MLALSSDERCFEIWPLVVCFYVEDAFVYFVSITIVKYDDGRNVSDDLQYVLVQFNIMIAPETDHAVWLLLWYYF